MPSRSPQSADQGLPGSFCSGGPSRNSVGGGAPKRSCARSKIAPSYVAA